MFIKKENDGIREIIKGFFYAIHWEDDEVDCFTDVKRKLTDPEYLFNFFEDNPEVMSHYNRTDTEKAVTQTRREMLNINKKMYRLSNAIETGDDQATIDTLFQPLHKLLVPSLFTEGKLRGLDPAYWIRLYAIRIEPDLYCFTGGGIKTGRTMQGTPLEIELEKLKLAKLHLINTGYL